MYLKVLLNKINKNKWLLIILLIASLLRLLNIDHQSLWLDELHSMNEANPKFTFLDVYNEVVKGEQMPPLYFYCLYLLFKIFGYTSFIARLFSAIAGIISILAIYFLGKEIKNKKTGLFAALITAFNSFHIYYSQEARPYIFLFLFSTISIYFLTRFIKDNTNKKVLLFYILSSCLMIYSHFFGIFVLISQYIIFLIFLLLENKSKKSFFYNILFSGIIILILYLPSLKILISISKITQFWIPKPTQETLTLIFKEFFDNSELLTSFISIFILYYFMIFLKEKNFKMSYDSIVLNKNLLGFIILAIWILVTVLIPLIRSYLSVPMLISRYFISILASLIIIVAISWSFIKNKFIQLVIISIFILLSIINIFVVKNYYYGINKSQFREASNFVIQNNINNELVTSKLAWYVKFFFKNDKSNLNLIEKSLEEVIKEMQQDSTKIKPFWHIDGFGNEYNPDEGTLEFINKYFYIENNYDGFQAWTKHFILLKDASVEIDVKHLINSKSKGGDKITSNFDMYKVENGKIISSGWAFIDGQDCVNNKISIVLIKEDKAIKLPTQKFERKDVDDSFNNEYNLLNSGFYVDYSTASIDPGTYKVAVYIEDLISNKKGLVLTDKIFEK